MHILVVDDNNDSLHSLCLVLRDLGHKTTATTDALLALEEAAENFYPLIISDIRMPALNGLELLERIKENLRTAASEVLLITGYADLESAVQALRNGAYDYLNKPINAAELSVVVERCAEKQRLLQENLALREDLSRAEEATQELRHSLEAVQEQLRQVAGVGEVVAESPYMRSLMDEALIFHANPTVPVLIEGETGTGKEILARLIHYGLEKGPEGQALSKVESPFVALNCSAIPHELFGSELFGHEQGAFTGSRAEGATGKLEQAGAGTLFLDEISEMPYDMQPKLLRVLEDRSFYRLGGKHERKFKARVVCAGNRSLAQMVEDGLFRRDLYHRLSVGHLVIPPLRRRQEEIQALALFFLKREAKLKKKRFTGLTAETLEFMRAYPWLGNVRELRNAIERAVLLNDDLLLRPEHLAFLTRLPFNEPRSLNVRPSGTRTAANSNWADSSAGHNGHGGYGGRESHGQTSRNGAQRADFYYPEGQAGLQPGADANWPRPGSSGVLLSGDGQYRGELRGLAEGPVAGQSGAGLPAKEASLLDAQSLALPDGPLDLEELYDVIIRKALDKFDGNKSKTAEYLNISRFALHRRLKKD